MIQLATLRSFRRVGTLSMAAALAFVFAASAASATTAAEYRSRAAQSQAKAEKAERIKATLVRAGGRFQQRVAPVQDARIAEHRRQQAEYNYLAEAASAAGSAIGQ